MARQDAEFNIDLANLVLTCRTRLRPPGPAKYTQEAVADAIGVHVNTYKKYEAGLVQPQAPIETLDKLAEVLEMSPGERRSLFVLMRGHEPPALPGPYRTPEDLIASCAHMTIAAYVHDRYWNVLAANRLFLEWFPALGPGANAAEWTLTAEAARVELLDWHERWALPMLQQINTMRAETGDPILAEMWDRLRHTTRNVPGIIGRSVPFAEIREKMVGRTVVRMRLVPLTAKIDAPEPFTLMTVRSADEPLSGLFVPTQRGRDARRTAKETWQALTSGEWQLPDPKARR